MSETAPQNPDEVPVRILTVCLDAGLPEQVLTLYEGDDVRELPSGDLEVTLLEGPELLRFREPHIRWHSVRRGLAPSKTAIKAALEREVARVRGRG